MKIISQSFLQLLPYAFLRIRFRSFHKLKLLHDFGIECWLRSGSSYFHYQPLNQLLKAKFISCVAAVFVGQVDIIYMTHIHQEYKGDAFFPSIDLTSWKKVSEEVYPSVSFVEYRKN